MINKLTAKIQKTKAPIVVGLDPMLNYIPKHIQEKAFQEFGETLEGAAEAIWQFNKEIVDKTYDLIPAVKPQIAMYEQFGRRLRKLWITAGKKIWWLSEILKEETSVLRLPLMPPDMWEKYRWEKTELRLLMKIL